MERPTVEVALSEARITAKRAVTLARAGNRQAQGALLLVGLGTVFLFDALGMGWAVGAGLAAFLIWLGTLKRAEGGNINWWLVGFGSLIGIDALGGIFHTALPAFPLALMIVGSAMMWDMRQRARPQF